MLSDPCNNLYGIAALTPSSPTEPSGSWDSIHVFEASERGRQAHYKLTSTVMLHMVGGKTSKDADGKGSSGSVDLSGSMTRQVRLVQTHSRMFCFSPAQITYPSPRSLNKTRPSMILPHTSATLGE